MSKKGAIAMNTKIFWIFGTLQSITLGVIIFLILRSLNAIEDTIVVGLDTRVLLSIFFPLFRLLTEYVIFTKK